jgi:oxygen-independent coproporphyrinogen-3 oxidase
VQDLTPEVQAIINRYQSEEATVELFHYCRAQGFGSINIDLIYGLPLQTLETFGRTLDTVIALRPDRVAMYSFAFVPWKSGNQNVMTEDMLPPAELKVQLYLLGVQRFGEAGYKQIGMDHFAVPTDELAVAMDNKTLHRNFMGYTTKPANDMVAFGASGIGDVQGAYVQNIKNNSDYFTAIDAGALPILRGVQLSPEDTVRRYVITQIMCNLRVDFADVRQRFDIDFAQHFASELEALQDPTDSGFVVLADNGITVTSLGRVFVRNIAMVFDEYRQGEPKGRTFSRTI